MHFDHIVLTTDFSESSFAAFDVVALEKKMQGSKITLLHVIDDAAFVLNFEPLRSYPFDVAEFINQYQIRAKEALEREKTDRFHGQEVNCVVLLRDGEPGIAAVIAKFAKEHNADLIVSGSHGRGAVGTFFIGSTVQQLLRHAECPILIVPTKRNRK